MSHETERRGTLVQDWDRLRKICAPELLVCPSPVLSLGLFPAPPFPCHQRHHLPAPRPALPPGKESDKTK